MVNYHGISLMNHCAKLYNRLILNRLRPVIDATLCVSHKPISDLIEAVQSKFIHLRDSEKEEQGNWVPVATYLKSHYLFM